MMKMHFVKTPTPLSTLLERYRKKKDILAAERLVFEGAEGYDVYNISSPFTCEKKTYIAGRVEKRESEISSTQFFERRDDGVYEATPFHIRLFQDPFIQEDGEGFLFGGTRIVPDKEGGIETWWTELYSGRHPSQFRPFASAPEKMKDVRLIRHGDYHIFTRPQGGKAGLGKIGYTRAKSLAEIDAGLIEKAPILHEHFPAGTWGGANELHILKNGLIGVVGHIATMSAGDIRHYYGMVFAFDPETQRSTEVKIVMERADLPAGEAKREDLEDVVFLGSLKRNTDDTATLYAGVSDCFAAKMTIIDPFKEYESR